jgi:hypothetical protein
MTEPTDRAERMHLRRWCDYSNCLTSECDHCKAALDREVEASRQRPAAQAASAEPVAWIAVTERMPEDGAQVMTLRPREEWMWDDNERYGMDMRDDGVWVAHNNSREHFEAVGGAGATGPGEVCTGPAEEAPYTHWAHLLPLPDARATPPGERPAAPAQAAVTDAERKIAAALQRIGFTLLKTGDSYDVRKFGPITAQASPAQPSGMSASDAWRCACGAALYIDAEGKPRSKAADGVKGTDHA